MPRRNGFTTAHDMRTVDGKPDVQGTLCMKDCVKEVRIASEPPLLCGSGARQPG